MTDKQVKDYILKREAEGIDDFDIDKELLDKGVTQEQLDRVSDIICEEYMGGVR